MKSCTFCELYIIYLDNAKHNHTLIWKETLFSLSLYSFECLAVHALGSGGRGDFAQLHISTFLNGGEGDAINQ